MRVSRLMNCILPTLTRIVCFLLCTPALADAETALSPSGKPFLHPLFSDEAVLQRNQPITIWGWAAPSAEVKVTLLGNGLDAKPVTAIARADGRWQAQLGPFAPGGPYVLTASSGNLKAEARDILIGDVWLCSGQSNMQFQVKGCKDFAEEKAHADLPQIRHLFVPRQKTITPQELIQSRWKVCKPETVGEFTGVGFFFGRKLNEDLKVPIGLIHSSYGGTNAESWTSAEALASLPDEVGPLRNYQRLVKGATEEKGRTGKEYPARIAEWYQTNDPGSAASPAWSAKECDDSGWKKIQLPGTLENFGEVGTVWVRREFTVPSEAEGKSAILKLGVIRDFDTVWVNGQQVGASEDDNFWGQERAYKIPASLLKPGTNMIAVRMVGLTPKSGFVSNADAMKLLIDNGPRVPLAGKWRAKVGVALAKAPPLPSRYDRDEQPTAIFNAMIAPLIPMSIKGVIWYQGENNQPRAAQYQPLLTTLIGDWRSRFGQGDFPFLIVSLANWQERAAEPQESTFAEVREAQALTAKSIANGGLAVTIDLGDAIDIHPTNKQEVGRRLGLVAERVAYGMPIEWSGPWYKSMAVEEHSMRLKFDHIGSGLVTSNGGPLTGFAIAGEDQVFHWADARIDGDTVVASSPQVGKPVAVRYAWAQNPACNLANKNGLPAVPFRTDVWPNKYPPQRR